VKVAGVDMVDIPSTIVLPLRLYDTHDHTGIFDADATNHAVRFDGKETCEGQVVLIERVSIGTARLFTNE